MGRVIAVTLNWNGAEDTVSCVASLLRARPAPHQIVVCDNASRECSVARLFQGLAGELTDFVAFDSLDQALACERRPLVVLIQTGGNLGYAGGINVGLRYALSDRFMDYAWILNNDTEVDPKAVWELMSRMQKSPGVGICGATLVQYANRERVQALGGSSYSHWRARSSSLGFGLRVDEVPGDPSHVEERLAYVNGAAMFVRRAYLEDVGLMDESYFLYSEEHDWAQRGRDRFRFGWAPRALVFHKHGATIGTAPGGGSPLSLFYLFRGKLMFISRHFPGSLPTAVVSLLVEALKLALKGHPKKALAALRGLVGAASSRVGAPGLDSNSRKLLP
jgi:GT2 family glycosyltransferase